MSGFVYNPPPTFAEIIIKKQGVSPSGGDKEYTFNPIWLKWFIDLAANLKLFQFGVNQIQANTFNNITVTTPAVGATLTIADGKTFTVLKTLTFTGTDGVTITLPTTSAAMARTDTGQTFTGNQIITGTLKVSTANGYLASDASPGITTTVTTGSLVGKTITIKDGLVIGFA